MFLTLRRLLWLLVGFCGIQKWRSTRRRIAQYRDSHDILPGGRRHLWPFLPFFPVAVLFDPDRKKPPTP